MRILVQLVIAQMHCLRDWLMALPVQAMAKSGSLPPLVINSVFQVWSQQEHGIAIGN